MSDKNDSSDRVVLGKAVLIAERIAKRIELKRELARVEQQLVELHSKRTELQKAAISESSSSQDTPEKLAPTRGKAKSNPHTFKEPKGKRISRTKHK